MVGNDIITRLSYQSFNDLKNAVMDAIHTTKQPKYRILLSGCCSALTDLICRGGHSLVYAEPPETKRRQDSQEDDLDGMDAEQGLISANQTLNAKCFGSSK